MTTLNPDPWYAWFKYSHPGLFERLKRIKARLIQIEQSDGMEPKAISAKIQEFLEKYVSISAIFNNNKMNSQTATENNNNRQQQQ